MRFDIGSLRFVKYIEKKPTQYQPDFWGRQPSVGNFKEESISNFDPKLTAKQPINV